MIVGVGRGLEYTQNLSAFDPDGESLAFEFSALNPGTPDYAPTSRLPGGTLDQFGNFRIPADSTSALQDNTIPLSPGADYMEKFVVRDSSGAFSERDIMIDAVNRTPPVLDPIGNRTVAVGETITVNVTGNKGLSGANTIRLRTSALPTGGTFTGGGSTTAATVSGTFSWTPTASQVGTHGINFEVVADYVSPPQLADSEFVQITVVELAANRPPLLEEIANLRVGAAPLNVQAFVNETKVFDAVATDPNNDPLTYSVPILIDPNGNSVAILELGVSIANTTDSLGRVIGLVTISPGPEDVGVWQLRVRVDDGNGGSDEHNVFISVGTFTNQSPVYNTPPDEIFAEEGSLIEFTFSASDPDASQVVTLRSVGKPPGASFPDGISGNPVSATFSWIPALGQAGDYSIFFDAEDNAAAGSRIIERKRTIIHVTSACPTQVRIISLSPNSGPPAGGTPVTLRGQGFCGSVTVTIGGNPVTDLTVVSSSQLSFKTPPGTAGQADDVVVTAAGGSAPLVGGFLYSALANRAPVANNNSYTTNEDTTLVVLGTSGVLANDTDADGNALTAVLVNGPTNVLSFTLNSNGSFSYTPKANFNGTDSFTYKARDPSNAESNVATVTITVNPVNDPPVLSPIGNKTVKEGESLQFTVSGADVDGDLLTFSASGLPAGASFNSSTGTFSYTPGFGVSTSQANSFFDVFFTASDGQGGSDSETVRITVIDAVAPFASFNAKVEIEFGSRSEFEVKANFTLHPESDGIHPLT